MPESRVERPHLRSVLSAIDQFLTGLPREDMLSVCEAALRLRKQHKELRALYPGALIDLIEERAAHHGIAVEYDLGKPIRRHRRSGSPNP